MTNLDRIKAQQAALFLLELLYRDEMEQDNPEEAACHAQAIMAVRRVVEKEPR